MNKTLSELTFKEFKKIKMIVFDVDGVMVPRGTKIKQEGGILTLETKTIPEEQIEQVRILYNAGYHINISSGRGLYMLQDMFRTILPYVSLTYENGSCTWFKGELIQHVNSFNSLEKVQNELLKIKHNNIKGFEPKEFIITLHCWDRVSEVENLLLRYSNLYCLWNGEAYDIGIKNIQTKGTGITELSIKYLSLEKENVLAIGDNYNDIELLKQAGIGISADITRLKGDYFISTDETYLPAYVLMNHLILLLEE